MKKSKSYFRLFTGLVILLFLNQSCEKPFDGVNAILTNVKIDHKVNVQIIDANPNATNPYPANPVITLAGDAVDQGLLYTTAGELLNNSSGSAKSINNTVSLAVKPFTIISKSQPLHFYIKAEAANYISNTKEITISSLDSLQYINLSLLKISSLPDGVANTTTQTAVVNGTIAQDFVVNVDSKIAGTNTTENVVTATFPANTVFKDAANNPITTSGDLNISVTNFSASTPESVTSLPGGTTASTGNGVVSTFILAGAVDITANIGGTDVKSFSTPIPFEINLSSEVFNPTTNSTIKVGDQLPVWSKDANSVTWKKEGVATVYKDATTGALQTTILVSHLSVWMVAFDSPNCANTTTLNFVSSSPIATSAFIKINVNGGSDQLVDTKLISFNNGDAIELQLGQNLNYTVSMYLGASDKGTLLSTINLAACAVSGTLTSTSISTNPTLSFDLQTSCPNGSFRYNGAIEYKVAGTKLWLPFTPSIVGKLSTNLLAWDVTYDFRIIYNNVEFKRTRKVLAAEFRQAADGSWQYFGKSDTPQTFFSSPSACN